MPVTLDDHKPIPRRKFAGLFTPISTRHRVMRLMHFAIETSTNICCPVPVPPSHSRISKRHDCGEGKSDHSTLPSHPTAHAHQLQSNVLSATNVFKNAQTSPYRSFPEIISCPFWHESVPRSISQNSPVNTALKTIFFVSIYTLHFPQSLTHTSNNSSPY